MEEIKTPPQPSFMSPATGNTADYLCHRCGKSMQELVLEEDLKRKSDLNTGVNVVILPYRPECFHESIIPEWDIRKQEHTGKVHINTLCGKCYYEHKNDTAFKKRSRLYYWWQRKKEAWYYLTKGKFFVFKCVVDENQVVQSEWFLNQSSHNDKSFVWDAKPVTLYPFIIAAILLSKYKKKEEDKSIKFGLTEIHEHVFKEQVWYGEPKSTSI